MRKEFAPQRAQRVAPFGVHDDLVLPQLRKTRIEDARVGFGRLLQRTEGQWSVAPELPQNAQGRAPSQQIEQHHDRPPGR